MSDMNKLTRYVVTESDGGEPRYDEDDNENSVEFFYEEAIESFSHQSGDERIFKVNVTPVSEVEILYDYFCPLCKEKGTALKEDGRILCIQCRKWEDDPSLDILDEVDDTVKTVVGVLFKRFIDEGKSMDEIRLILKALVRQKEKEQEKIAELSS